MRKRAGADFSQLQSAFDSGQKSGDRRSTEQGGKYESTRSFPTERVGAPSDICLRIVVDVRVKCVCPDDRCAASTVQIPGPLHATPAVPIGRPGDWASDNDYPVTALRNHSTGIAYFRLTIDSTGTPSACEITKSSSDAELDKTTCDLMLRRARFKPATDASGRSATSHYSSSVRWNIPNPDLVAAPLVPPPAPLGGRWSTGFDLLADGTTANCTVTITGDLAKYAPSDGGQAQCARLGIYSAVRDAAGKPVKKHIVIEKSVTISDAP